MHKLCCLNQQQIKSNKQNLNNQNNNTSIHTVSNDFIDIKSNGGNESLKLTFSEETFQSPEIAKISSIYPWIKIKSFKTQISKNLDITILKIENIK